MIAALKYIFAVLLIAAAWTVVLLLDLPKWVAIVATVVIVVVLATYVIIKVVRAKAAAREIERALKAQADRHAASARPDLRGDIDAMQQEFLRAIAALKTSKLAGKTPAEALYALPWYMIIGPPGAGKSTALRNSGLRFPYLSKSGGGVQGVGGTRNCQWWMTNDAVILDTAGRYTTEDSDREEWLSFLDLLKRNRPKQPINGVMVAIAVTDISEAHPEDVHTRAREIRSRIDEVMAKLEMVVPVYVLFTKLDLLPGFVELFGDLGNSERRQIWGFTAPVSVRSDPAQMFVQNFDELSATIERRALRRMGDERRAETRDKVWEFPQYFEPMRDKLAAFVGELMADNVYAESPYMRGAYFTSGTQEGRTIDRIMNSMAAAFGIQPKIAYTTPQIEPKSYFLGELFEKVIFPDKQIAARSAAKLRKQAMVGHAIGFGLVLVAVGLATLPVMSFTHNRDFLTGTADAIGKIEEHTAAKTSEPITLANLSPLLDVERTFTSYDADGVPLKLRMGMYQGDFFRAQARLLFLRTVKNQLVKPLLDIEVEKLDYFRQRYIATQEECTEEEHQEFEARLRMYLLLTGIAKGEEEIQYPVPGEPGLDAAQTKWLREKIADRWLGPIQMAGDIVATRDTMLKVADSYLAIIGSQHEYLFQRNVRLVDDVRKILKRTNQIDAMLNQLLASVDAKDKGLLEVTGTTRAVGIDGGKRVRGIYTREAWDTQIAELLKDPVASLGGNEWVLGMSQAQDAERRELLREELRSRYFEDYIKEWKNFLGATYVRQPGTPTDLTELLKSLSAGANPPLKFMALTLEYQTTLQDPAEPEPEEEESSALDQGLEVAEKAGGKAAAAAKKAKKAKALADKLRAEKEAAKARNPLLKQNEDVKKEFEPFIAFGHVPPPPAPEGAPAPPPTPVPLDTYQEELKKVRDGWNRKLEEPGPEATKALLDAVDGAITATNGLLTEQEGNPWQSQLKRLLLPPLQGARTQAAGDVATGIQAQYCTDVYQPMMKLLERYPFKKDGKSMASQMFTDFFTPETGSLWKYYDNSPISSAIPLKNNSFAVAKQGTAATTEYNRQVALFLNRALDLTRAMFPVGSDKMFVEFEVLIVPNKNVASSEVEIDGQLAKYTNAPDQWFRMHWPGETKSPGGFIRAKGLDKRDGVSEPGFWGLFAALEEGTVSGDGRLFKLAFDFKASGIDILEMRVRPADPDLNPFFGNSDRPVDFLGLFRHPDLVPPQAVIIGRNCKSE